MSNRARFGILLAVVGILVAVFGIFVVSRVVQRSLAPPPVPTPIPPLTANVVIATHDLPLGAVLKAGDLALREVPLELVPAGALTEPEQAVGRLITIPMVAGELVLPHHLADPSNVNHDLAFTLAEGEVLMAFPADDLLSSLNILQRGDRVDILVSIEEPVQPLEEDLLAPQDETQTDETRLFTFNALQRVEIQAVVVEVIAAARRTTGVGATSALTAGADATPQPTPTPQPEDVQVQALLLALSPQDALVLKHLQDAGGIVDLVLRNPNSTQLYEPVPVLPEYLIDRYGLELGR